MSCALTSRARSPSGRRYGRRPASSKSNNAAAARRAANACRDFYRSGLVSSGVARRANYLIHDLILLNQTTGPRDQRSRVTVVAPVRAYLPMTLFIPTEMLWMAGGFVMLMACLLAAAAE